MLIVDATDSSWKMDRSSGAPFAGHSVVSGDDPGDSSAHLIRTATSATTYTLNDDATRLSRGSLSSVELTAFLSLTPTPTVQSDADYAPNQSDEKDGLLDVTSHVSTQESRNKSSISATDSLAQIHTFWGSSTPVLPEVFSRNNFDGVPPSVNSLVGKSSENILVSVTPSASSSYEQVSDLLGLNSLGALSEHPADSALTYPIFYAPDIATTELSAGPVSDSVQEFTEDYSRVYEDFIELNRPLDLANPQIRRQLTLEISSSSTAPVPSTDALKLYVDSAAPLEPPFPGLAISEDLGGEGSTFTSAIALIRSSDNSDGSHITSATLALADLVPLDTVNAFHGVTFVSSASLHGTLESHSRISDVFTESFFGSDGSSTPFFSHSASDGKSSVALGSTDDITGNDSVFGGERRLGIRNDFAIVGETVNSDTRIDLNSTFQYPQFDYANTSVASEGVSPTVAEDLSSVVVRAQTFDSSTTSSPVSSFIETPLAQTELKDSFELDRGSIPFAELTPTVHATHLPTVTVDHNLSDPLTNASPLPTVTITIPTSIHTSFELVYGITERSSEGLLKTFSEGNLYAPTRFVNDGSFKLTQRISTAAPGFSDIFASYSTSISNLPSEYFVQHSRRGVLNSSTADSVTRVWHAATHLFPASPRETKDEVSTVPVDTADTTASLEPSLTDHVSLFQNDLVQYGQVSLGVRFNNISSADDNSPLSTSNFETSFTIPSLSHQAGTSGPLSDTDTSFTPHSTQTAYFISDSSIAVPESSPLLSSDLTEPILILYGSDYIAFQNENDAAIWNTDSVLLDITPTLLQVTSTTQAIHERDSLLPSEIFKDISSTGSLTISEVTSMMANATTNVSSLQPSLASTFNTDHPVPTAVLSSTSTQAIPPVNNPVVVVPKTDTSSLIAPTIQADPITPSTTQIHSRLASAQIAPIATPSIVPTPTSPKTSLTVSNISPRMTNGMYNVSGPIDTTPKTSVATTENGGMSSEPTSDMKTAVVIASACAVFVLILVLVLAIVCIRRKRKAKSHSPRQRGDDLWVDLNSSNPAHQMPLPSLTTCASQFEIAATVKPENLYKVHYPFKGQQEGQLALKEGDILQLVEKTSNGWWRGVMVKDGASGWFPSSYVTSISSSTDDLTDGKNKSSSQPNSPLVCRVKPQRHVSSFQIKKTSPDKENDIGMKYPILEANEGLNHVECWVNMAASVSMTSLPTTEMSYSTNITDFNLAAVGHRFRAVYAYKPVCKGELGLKEGELVICKERDRNGWMLGSKPKTNEEGWFPAVYVDEISSDDDMFCGSDVPDTIDLLDANKLHKLDQCWVGIEHKAQWGYESSVPGDLNFEPDDVIIVLQTLANGWWFGVCGDKCGWFPGSYVEMIEDDSLPSQPPNNNEEKSLDQTGSSRSDLDKKSLDQTGSSRSDLDTSVASTIVVPSQEAEINENTNKTQSAEKIEPETLPFSTYSSIVNVKENALSTNDTNQQNPIPETANVKPADTASTPDSRKVRSHTSVRPNRQAPPPPPGTPASSSTAKLGQSLSSAEKQGESVRRPARPAPPPPKRKDSKVSKDEVKSAGTGQEQPDSNTPNAPGVAKPVILVRGKRPKLKKIPRKQLDDKHLNPMIRPSTRPFVPKPSETARCSWVSSDAGHKTLSLLNGTNDDVHKTSSQSITDDFSKELMTILNQPHQKDAGSSGHLSPSVLMTADDGRSSSRASLESRSDSKVTSPSLSSHPSSTKGHSPSHEHPGLSQSKSVGGHFPIQRSLTPDSKSGRAHSPVLLTTGNLLQNVKRFNRSVGNASPVPSIDSDKGSVRSTSTLKAASGDVLNTSSSQAFKKRNGRRHRTLTTVPPPRVPAIVPNKHKGGQPVQNSSNTRENGHSDARDLQTSDPKSIPSHHLPYSETADLNKEGEELADTARHLSNTPRSGDAVPARDSLVVVPGKVSEIVHQINSMSPVDTEMIEFPLRKKSSFGLQESAVQDNLSADPKLTDEPCDAMNGGVSAPDSNGVMSDKGTRL